MESIYDFKTLFATVCLGTGIGFIVAVTVYWFLRGKKTAMTLLVMGALMIVASVIIYTWPTLVKVPDLTDKSQAEAELILAKKQLLPDIQPKLLVYLDFGIEKIINCTWNLYP